MSIIFGIFLFLSQPLPPAAIKSVALITFDVSSDEQRMCSGIVVDAVRGHVLTAAHCIPDNLSTFRVDGKPGIIIKRDGQFALIQCGMKRSVLVLRSTEPVIGEPIIIIGFAWGELAVFGRLVASVKEGDFATDGAIAPGMSGGPILDSGGLVIGMSQASSPIVGIACGSREIREFLRIR